MRKINKRLIVSDFDGTLLTSNHDIPPEVRAAINEYVSCGGIFAVCTGRMLSSILPRVRELGLKGLVVAYQGSVIADIESGRIIKKDFLEFEEVAELCRFIKGLDQSVNLYSDEVFYCDLPKDDPYLINYETVTGVQSVFIHGNASEFVIKNKLNCQKIACLVSTEKRDLLYKTLSEKFGTRFDVTCSAHVLVEISPLRDNKGAAHKYMAEHFGVPIEETVAIGDNLNDLSMIKAAGVGVAVGNATQALKDAADCVTVTNNECAVAKIIEKYGFV